MNDLSGWSTIGDWIATTKAFKCYQYVLNFYLGNRIKQYRLTNLELFNKTDNVHESYFYGCNGEVDDDKVKDCMIDYMKINDSYNDGDPIEFGWVEIE